MKVKVYESDNKVEIKLSDDTIFTPKKGESKEDFIERVRVIVADEHLDDEFDIIEINKETVAENDDDTLIEAMKTAEGVQKQLIQEVLVDRGLIKAKPVAKAKVDPMTPEEMKATEHYKEASAQVGKYISFSPFKSEEVHTGKIAGVALNKTNTIVYYTVVEESGKRRCCGVKNETVKFIDAPVKEATVTDETAETAEAKPKATKAKAKTKAEKVKEEALAAKQLEVDQEAVGNKEAELEDEELM